MSLYRFDHGRSDRYTNNVQRSLYWNNTDFGQCVPEQVTSASPKSPNRFDRMEWAGAFGDLGTLIPFVVAYLAVVKMQPFGVLFSLGVSMLASGLYYRTPFPVQPMKAIGAVAATQAAQTAIITQGTVLGAGLVTGLAWLLLGLSGAAHRVGRWVPRYIVVGIVLGLGMGFMLQGIRMMSSGWLIASIGLIGTVLLLANKTFPAMFLLLLFGVVCGIAQNPTLVSSLAGLKIQLQLPSIALLQITYKDLLIGGTVLALPQIPLTLGNAVIAIKDENNRLFPDRPVTENGVATSTGVMNLFSAVFGGVPMCHGAGGMAGHVAFGAKTGGAPIILGVILLLGAFFLSGSVALILELFPRAVLGVILFLTGAQLALGSCDFSKDKEERFITLVTAAFSVWNVGLAFVVGLILSLLKARGLLRL
jgi:MFS superfamily molybdate transporter